MSVESLILRELQTTDELAFRAAIAEFAEQQPDWQFAFQFEESPSFAAYVDRLHAWTRGERLDDGFVPNTYLVGVVGDQIVGRVSLRHELNDFLKRMGGHIGYAVVPSARGKGYAKEMLRQAFVRAKSLGIERVLITCDETNLASRRVVEANGGVLECVVQRNDPQPALCRYWVDLHAT